MVHGERQKWLEVGDIWPDELFSYLFKLYNITFDWQPSSFVFSVKMRFENIYVQVQFQGHRAIVKVTAAKTGNVQNCAPFEHSLIMWHQRTVYIDL